MKRTFQLLFALVAVFGLSAQAYATLSTIGTATYNSSDYNLIYDDDNGIAWLDYSNTRDTWLNQFNWAAGLSAAGVLTYNLNPGTTITWGGDWRLPGVNPTCGLYPDCTNEMGHLYYMELVNGAGGPLVNTGDFQNLTANAYWSGTSYILDSNGAWLFNFDTGNLFVDDKPYGYRALAVRPGVVSAPVSEPGTMLLLGSGLVGLIVIRKRLAGLVSRGA